MSVVFDGFSWKCKIVSICGRHKADVNHAIYQVIFHIYFKKYSLSISIDSVKRMCKPFECFDVSHYFVFFFAVKNTYQRD